MIYVSKKKPNQTLQMLIENMAPHQTIEWFQDISMVMDMIQKQGKSSVIVDIGTITLDLVTINKLLTSCENLVLIYMENYRRKKKVGIFSRGRANVRLFETVSSALVKTGLAGHATLINMYKPQITEITSDDISFDRSFTQEELQEVNLIALVNLDAATAIMEQLPKFDLAILGFPNHIDKNYFLWELISRIQNADAPTSFIFLYQRQGIVTSSADESDPALLFLKNTFPRGSFDKRWIKQRKQDKEQKIALVIPAFNEEETLETVISCYIPLKSQGILDRIVVIDNDSTDNTSAVARKAGAEVYKSSEIKHELGAYRGKGEALWKSLFVLDNMDIVAFLDADIKNPTEEMFLNIVGPLVLRKDLQLVKGYFNRGGAEEKTLKSGGGRVTEILVRPLLSMEMPELLFLFQPLSGFTAARMELLRSVPFYTGYGIEIGFLLHTAKMYGVNAIAQSDVG
jgi:hypothetical protein